MVRLAIFERSNGLDPKGQVPMTRTNFKSYALLGSGRVAKHFQFYLKSLNLPVQFWSRNGDPQFNSLKDLNPNTRLEKVIAQSSHLLFAVRDEALAELTRAAVTHGKTLVHFSGAVHLDGVFAAHPLMTFGPNLESPPWYRQIPFVHDAGVDFAEILPGVPNPSWPLSKERRALYHALCSLAGNSSFLLWQNIGNRFERELGLPRALLSPLLHQVVENAAQNQAGGFTGPVARGDWQTVGQHLTALKNLHPDLLKVYHSYLALAQDTGHVVPEEMI
jgi:hypothetical protein